MKILYVTRLFSGLQSSLASGIWQPTGVPTIYRIIEALDRTAAVEFVLAAKDVQSTWSEKVDRIIELHGLRHPIRVLAGRNRFPSWMKSIRGVLREITHAMIVWRRCRIVQPDMIYIDHANIFVAAWLSLVTRCRIVLRIMGVYPIMRDALRGRTFRERLLKWCYGRKYDLIICSQDGSGVELWLEKALHPSVPRLVMLNGVDRPTRAETPDTRLPADDGTKTIVMFLGKLEPAKGIREFTDGFIKAWQHAPGALHALVIGSGSLAEYVRLTFAAAGAGNALTQIDKLPHDQVGGAFARADVYVSLNKLGNLSNANLEAMRIGKPMIIPQSQSDIGVDVATDGLMPPDTIIRIPSASDTEALAKAILLLHSDEGERKRRAARIAATAECFLCSWHERVRREIDMLETIALAKNHAEIADAARQHERAYQSSAGTTA